jgi:16S rRNA (cytidine1402-2'-O)-methyltransferase
MQNTHSTVSWIDVTAEPPTIRINESEARRPALVLVSTPIGNLGDLSPRALAALQDADAILCEDTRHTMTLLAAHGLRRRLIALHDHNEEQRSAGLIAAMQRGEHYALVSDAGAPLIADPGYRLVRAALAAGLPISAIPGPNAALMALALSGLPPQPFLFHGFLPPRSGQRRSAFAEIVAAETAGLSATLIFYEAPHRLAGCLQDAADILGDRPAAVARELTKRFEEVRRDSLAALAQFYTELAPRGEVTLIIAPPAGPTVPSEQNLDEALRAALRTQRVRDAASSVAERLGVPRNRAYQRALLLRSTDDAEPD